MKKFIAFMLSILFIVSVCSACTNKKIEHNGEKIELTVWAILSPECTDYETNRQSEWYYEKTGVKINWVTVPAQGWADAFQRSVMSGEWPDIYLYDFSTEEVKACVDYEVIKPLNELIENNCPNVNKWINEDTELKEAITSPDGNIYTLFAKSYDINEFTQKLWVNKSWLNKYKNATGNDIPKTTDEFEEMLLFFKNNDMNGNGDANDEIPYLGVNGRDGICTLINAFVPTNYSRNSFGCYNNGNGVKFTLKTDEYREGLKYVNKLYEKNLITDKTFTTSGNELYSYVGTDDSNSMVGVVTGGSIDNIIGLTNSQTDYDYDDFVVIPPLSSSISDGTYVTFNNTIALKDAITTNCKYPEEAAKWLDYWFSEEGRLWSVNGGEKDVQWWYDDGESITGKGKVVVHTTDDSLLENACWGSQGVSYMIGQQDFEKMDINSIAKNRMLATYMANEEYRKVAVDSGWPSLVWTTDETSEYSVEYSELANSIETYAVKGYTDFIIGERDINDDAQWKSYCEGYNELKLDRFIELIELYSKG